MKLRLNDQVEVIAGKDKGKKGKVIKVDAKNNRVVVEKINLRTKHIKKTAQRKGERIQYEASIDASNVMLIDPKTSKRTRVGYKFEGKKKVRVAKVSGEVLDDNKSTKKK